MADDGEILEPGSKKIGLIGTSGLVPVGYYKDEKKSAETFREINGTRYSFPGDYAKFASDGTITLLGRGSNCINSAGEKIYPEEVEEALIPLLDLSSHKTCTAGTKPISRWTSLKVSRLK